MGQIDPALRTPSTPFVTPRALGRQDEKRRHDDTPHQSEESPTTDDENLGLPQGDHLREDENKGTRIDIQI